MKAEKLHNSLKCNYPHIPLQLSHVEEYLATGGKADTDHLLDWAIDEGLIEL